MDQEIHIAGIVVFARPEALTAVAAQLRQVPSATVHAVSPDGKLVVTLETDSSRRTLDCMDAMRALPGVVDVSLVYQHAEPREDLEQEIEI
ncbi:MAG TPA: chaperone NapD [Noviherbaspirillum sp.]|uniref:chaperone NapD n=1 Tax=Noviherbaspirillum sp. TaxID=1926288 RepID=UPI002D716BC4|nr:chaperone NapD [Noviherbaspirillum sp.]HYD95226.1 chaperone NapD [Noviherbaspirillum sp.]